MTATATMDKSGRLVLPRKIREQLRLTSTAKLNIEVVGDKIQLSEAPAEPRVERRGKRRVIAGWEGFEADKAVNEARRAQIGRLEAPFSP
ncbi:MAG: AbrB/MazE/SpoVT family DNA-binding domain-containing protein [Verrucomicrobiae bacterium]|nr:AbrB/MazE/SpoVT family DNA-binding domain-containing protein [Verrucomicrobiae bacterium]